MINMNKNNNLTVNETFELALQSQQKKNFQEAENLYNKILKVEPNFILHDSERRLVPGSLTPA